MRGGSDHLCVPKENRRGQESTAVTAEKAAVSRHPHTSTPLCSPQGHIPKPASCRVSELLWHLQVGMPLTEAMSLWRDQTLARPQPLWRTGFDPNPPTRRTGRGNGLQMKEGGFRLDLRNSSL